MGMIGPKVICKYLNNLTLFQSFERKIRDSRKVNMRNDYRATQPLPERAQKATPNIKNY
jgi:hypothetical protein